jgi:predicted nucleic acid-binding protein
MAERIVVDTGPLIALARADALGAVSALPLEFIAPVEVRQELDEGERRGHAPVVAPWLRYVQSSTSMADAIARAELGSGEAAVIHLALEQRIGTVVIDERKGRRAALVVGLHVTGSLGLLGRAKRAGVIPAVSPFIERLRVAGWFDAKLLEGFVAALGE